jgi:ABC-2 type transport system permease protein
MGTIYILWLRQVKKYMRSRSRIVGAIGQPVLYLIAFGYGFSAIFSRAGAGNYIQFLAPGVIMMSVLFSAIFSGIEIIWDRQFGFLKETLVAPVPRYQIMLGRTLGGATVSTAQGILVFLITLIFGFRPHNWAMVFPALVLTFLIALMFTALGTAIATQLEDMQGFQLIMNFHVMPIFFLSGALYPLQGLPRLMEYVTKIDPLTYGIDGVRQALINFGTYSLLTDFVIIAVLTTILVAVGSYLFQRIQI